MGRVPSLTAGLLVLMWIVHGAVIHWEGEKLRRDNLRSLARWVNAHSHEAGPR
jgi:hypothetical protein